MLLLVLQRLPLLKATTPAMSYSPAPTRWCVTTGPGLTKLTNYARPQSHTIPVPSSHQGCRQRRRHPTAPGGVEGGGETGLTPNSADGAGLAQQTAQTMCAADPQRVLHGDGGEGGVRGRKGALHKEGCCTVMEGREG